MMVVGRGWLAWGLLVASGCSSGPPPPDLSEYVQEVAEAREAKNRQFAESADSPVPPDQLNTLLPLKYYAVDPVYRVPALLQLADETPVFEMPTSTGLLRRMERVGVLEFTFQGQPMSLGAFVEEGAAIDSLFVPFADTTTGTETYAAGRYLDIFPTSTGYYTVDFNDAYNPYCAYNASYDCPFPPSSNRLSVPIHAGELAPGE